MTIQDTFLDRLQAGVEPADDLAGFGLSLLAAIGFGLMLKLLYGLYFRENEPQDGSLARSLVLLTPALTATFWMIQSSLVMSLGLLGSLSFVRFRTPVKRAEDVAFIVVVLAVSIACATSAFLIAGALMVLLLGYTLARNHLGGKLAAKHRFAVITFNTGGGATADGVLRALEPLRVHPTFISSRTYDGITSFVFNAARVGERSHDAITAALGGIDRAAHVNIFYPNERLGA